MNNYNYFKNIYDDFFNIETPKIEVQKQDDSIKNKNSFMSEIFNRINKININDDSKELLKKIIEYMRKYNEQIEKNYIQFRLLLEINNKKEINEIEEILKESATYFNYIDNNNIKEISLYNLEKEYNYNDFGFITLKDLSGTSIEEDKNIKKFIYEFSEYLKEDNKNIIIISGNKIEVNNFFLGKEELKNKYFELKIESKSMDVQSIYNSILNEIEIKDKLKVELLEYITNTFDKESDYIEYKDRIIQYISFNKSIPKLEEKKSLEEIFSELEELVGLEKVKKVLYELVDVIELKEKAKDKLKIKDLNLHMVFLGNPGTGKTTIARIISGILYNLGYIKENKLIEVSVKDLVAEYVGQTAPKTMSVIEKAMNGVLFIDEAYTLAVKGDNSYNAEAIATLIQAMENYRDKLVVIFAGYTKEMKEFLDSNSGIVSRIGYTLEFDDYTTEELIQIFLGFMKKSGFIVEEDAIKYLENIINENRNVKNFGNARFIRNIYEKSIIKHASNVKNNKRKDKLITITKEDISIENLNLK